MSQSRSDRPGRLRRRRSHRRARGARARRLRGGEAAHPWGARRRTCRPVGGGGALVPRDDGSGDPAFVKNFNPFTATGLPSGQFVRGAVYEGLTVSPEGGKPTLPWLARTWKWSNGNKTLTLNLAKGVKWSDGKPLTSTDVVYSLTAGKQNKIMDVVGFTRPETNIASVKAKGAYKVVINLKTPDSQFIAATLNQAVRHPASHLVEGREPRDVHEPESGRLRAVHEDHPLHLAGLRPEQEPELLAGGQAADRLPRVRAGRVERRRARADPERSGRLDAQLRPERRQGVHVEGQGALPCVLRDDRVPGVARVRQHEVPVQPRRVPPCALDGDRPQHGVEAR